MTSCYLRAAPRLCSSVARSLVGQEQTLTSVVSLPRVRPAPSSSVKITWMGLLAGPPRSEPRHMNLIRASVCRGNRRDSRPEVVSSQYTEAGWSLLEVGTIFEVNLTCQATGRLQCEYDVV